jgi:hypothetical protein
MEACQLKALHTAIESCFFKSPCIAILLKSLWSTR